MFHLAGTPQKVDKIHRETHFAYFRISSIQFKSEVQLFRLRIAINTILSSLLPKQPCFQTNIPSNRCYIALIFQIWYAPIGYEELAGGIGTNQQQRNILNE